MSSTDIRNGIIAGLVMLVIAGTAVLKGVLTGLHRKKVAATYSTTQALVTKRIQSSRYTESGLTPYLDHSAAYYVVLEYSVDDITYKIRRKSKWNLSQGSATVYYDPDNPGKAYTEEQVLGRYFTSWYLFGGIVGGLALSVVIYVLTQIGKPA